MLLNDINNKMPIYRDCTLGELMVVGGGSLLTMLVVFSLITHILFGWGWIGVGIAVIALVPVTRLLLGFLQKVKVGKPAGYYAQLARKRAVELGIYPRSLPFPFVTRTGRWSVRRQS